MCFRPAEMDTLGPALCPSCGKKVNRAAGHLPSKCPFCQVSLAEIEETPTMPAPSAPPVGASQAPKAPNVSQAPSASKAPQAPNPSSSSHNPTNLTSKTDPEK